MMSRLLVAVFIFSPPHNFSDIALLLCFRKG